MDLASTIAGSMLEGFFPAGWDLRAIDALISDNPDDILKRERWWHRRWEPVRCGTLEDFNMLMGHEIAMAIRRTRDRFAEAHILFFGKDGADYTQHLLHGVEGHTEA